MRITTGLLRILNLSHIEIHKIGEKLEKQYIQRAIKDRKYKRAGRHMNYYSDKYDECPIRNI